MSEMSTCLHCGDTMPARGSNNARRAFCSSRCNGARRAALNAKRRADREAKAEAALERNTRLLDSYLQERRARLARLERMT